MSWLGTLEGGDDCRAASAGELELEPADLLPGQCRLREGVVLLAREQAPAQARELARGGGGGNPPAPARAPPPRKQTPRTGRADPPPHRPHDPLHRGPAPPCDAPFS